MTETCKTGNGRPPQIRPSGESARTRHHIGGPSMSPPPNVLKRVGGQSGVKSVTRYSVAGVSRVARQVNWASERRIESTRTLTTCC